MNGLNPNYNTTRPNSGLILRNCCRNFRARDSLLSFATPSWFCRYYQRVHPLGEKLKLQHISFYLLIIHLSFYSVLISLAQNLHYKMLWVCSSRPLELQFLHNSCVETTSESHIHFAKHSPGEMETRPSIAQNITTTRNQTNATNCSTHNGMKVSIMPLKSIDVCFLIFAHRSPCQQCRDSVAGPDVGWSAAGIEFLVYHSNFVVHHFELKALKNCRHHPVKLGNQGLTPPLCTAQAPHRWLCTFTQGPKLIFMMRHTCPSHLTISLLDTIENCLLPAILENKHMNVTVYSPYGYFTIIETTKRFNKKIIKFPSTLFIHLCFL